MPWSWPRTSLFGLIHSFGSANILLEIDLPMGRLVEPLLGFNVDMAGRWIR